MVLRYFFSNSSTLKNGLSRNYRFVCDSIETAKPCKHRDARSKGVKKQVIIFERDLPIRETAEMNETHIEIATGTILSSLFPMRYSPFVRCLSPRHACNTPIPREMTRVVVNNA